MSLELLAQIFEVCIIPLLGILTKFIIDFLNAKREEAKAKTDSEVAQKYIDMIAKTVADCVIATNQTYVDSLKNKDIFDKSAQSEAFNKTLTAVQSILSEDVKVYLTELTGDFEAYLCTLIEAEVAKQKQEKGSI